MANHCFVNNIVDNKVSKLHVGLMNEIPGSLIGFSSKQQFNFIIKWFNYRDATLCCIADGIHFLTGCVTSLAPVLESRQLATPHSSVVQLEYILGGLRTA